MSVLSSHGILLSVPVVMIMIRQILSFLLKMLIVLLIGTVVLSFMIARYFLRLASDITKEFLRP